MKESTQLDPQLIIQAMQAKAKEFGLDRGAAVIYSSFFEGGCFHEGAVGDGYYRKPDIVNKGPNDSGTNYLAFAAGKIFMSMRTDRPSSSEGAMKGESAARGCLISVSHLAFFAFSGGTETQDVNIALEGLILYEKLMSEC